MPNRLIRDGILTSERVCRLSWPEEIFYRRLMSVVDDFGRYSANPTLLRAACYPLQIDKISDADVRKWLTACQKADLVTVYQDRDGKTYLELLDFRQQVRAKTSKYPAPDGGCIANAKQVISDAKHMQSNEHLDGDGDGDGDEDGGGDDICAEPETVSTPPVIEIPTVGKGKCGIGQEMIDQWSQAFPAVDVLQELRKMREWCLANPSRMKTAKGVRSFIVRWLSQAQDRGRGGNSVQPIRYQSSKPTTDDLLAHNLAVGERWLREST